MTTLGVRFGGRLGPRWGRWAEMAGGVRAAVDQPGAADFLLTAKGPRRHEASPVTTPALPLPLLITGIPGVPGYNALHYFQAKYPGQVFGIRQADNVRLAGPGILACNAEDREGMARLFDRYQFASVLDCAGNCA